MCSRDNTLLTIEESRRRRFESDLKSYFLLGTKLERAQMSLTSMGPAIVNGGITTFLALLLLGFSQSHVFVTFFKVSYYNVTESHILVAFYMFKN